MPSFSKNLLELRSSTVCWRINAKEHCRNVTFAIFWRQGIITSWLGEKQASGLELGAGRVFLRSIRSDRPHIPLESVVEGVGPWRAKCRMELGSQTVDEQY